MVGKIAGLNGIGKQIRKIIEKIQEPFNKVIDWCIDKVLQGIDWLKAKLGGGGNDKDAAKKAVQDVDEKAKTDGSKGGKSEAKSGKESNLPSVDGTDDASKDNAGSGNAGNIKGNVNLGGENAAQVLDKATDLAPTEFAKSYPSLSSKMEEADAKAQVKLKDSTPKLGVKQDGAKSLEPAKKIQISSKNIKLSDGIEGATSGVPQFAQLQTEGETLPIGAGERPNVVLDGRRDPARMSRMNAESMTEVNKVSKEVRAKLGQGVQLQGIAMDEEVSLDVGKNPDLPDTSQLAELTEFQGMNLDSDIQKALDKKLGDAIKSQMDQADKQALDARGTFEGSQKTAIDKAIADANQANADAQKEQEAAINTAKGEIATERDSVLTDQKNCLLNIEMTSKERKPLKEIK